MDLLFKRYASPFILLDELILTKSLSAYIDDLFKFIGEEKEEQTKWEFFLHKTYGKSWKEFCDDLESISHSEKVDLGDTITKSKTILSNFTPD